MASSVEARTEILRRIRVAGVVAQDAAAIDAEWRGIRREYKRVASVGPEELLHQLEDRLRDYDAGVYRSGPKGLREMIAKILSERGKHRMALPEGVPKEWLPEGVTFVEDTRRDVESIDRCDGVLTAATLAIAETGSIVLQDVPGLHSRGQGRRVVTLLPDYHLCVVDADDVVQTVPEAVAKLQATATLATTYFSGPSATADIEMTRIKGVHGPRFVDVILLLDETAASAESSAGTTSNTEILASPE
jgi:L-lactate dehydrogenase complex protein LldG